jgi:hypothetical protein
MYDHNAQCTMYIYNVQYTMYSEQLQCTMYGIQCTMYSYNVQYTIYNVQCTNDISQSDLRSFFCPTAVFTKSEQKLLSLLDIALTRFV